MPSRTWREGWLRIKRDLKRLQGSEPDRRSEAVHRIRVTTRRLQVLLKARPETRGKKKSRRLNKELKMLRKTLSKVRQADVHRLLWESTLSDLPYVQRLGEAIGQRREKALRELEKTWNRKRWTKLVKTALRRKAEKTAPLGWPTAQIRSVLSEADSVRRDKDPEAMHGLRLKVKKLRYFLEALDAPHSRRKAKSLSVLKEIQEDLGALHDRETLVAYLEKTARKSADAWDPRTQAGVEKACEDLKRRLRDEADAWRRRWPERRKVLAAFAREA